VRGEVFDVFGKRRRAERQAAREQALTEAAGEYIAAWIAGDEDRVDNAIVSVDPFALPGAVAELASRAVAALARERRVSVEEVITSLNVDEET
jgi:hypothetical protein